MDGRVEGQNIRIMKISSPEEDQPKCQFGLMRLIIESLTELPQDFSCKEAAYFMKVYLGKKKQQVFLPKQSLKQLNKKLAFICQEHETIKFELFKNQAEPVPHAFVEFPIKKLYAIKKVRHCLNVDMVDSKKLTGKKVCEMYGNMNLEISIFREHIGRLKLSKMEAVVQSGVQKYLQKDLHVVIKSGSTIYNFPIHKATGKNPVWYDINLFVDDVDAQMNFMVFRMGPLGETLLGEETLNFIKKGIFESINEPMTVDLPIFKDDERIIVFKMAGRFEPMENDLFL